MRLWHEKLLPVLPQKQLCGQWRECIALIGNGWGKKHSTVDYIFSHNVNYLISFTLRVYREMVRRGYKPNEDLIFQALSKRIISPRAVCFLVASGKIFEECIFTGYVYIEHNDDYLLECIENLKKKGIEI